MEEIIHKKRQKKKDSAKTCIQTDRKEILIQKRHFIKLADGGKIVCNKQKFKVIG